jgi:hypothetical protein
MTVRKECCDSHRSVHTSRINPSSGCTVHSPHRLTRIGVLANTNRILGQAPNRLCRNELGRTNSHAVLLCTKLSPCQSQGQPEDESRTSHSFTREDDKGFDLSRLGPWSRASITKLWHAFALHHTSPYMNDYFRL